MRKESHAAAPASSTSAGASFVKVKVAGAVCLETKPLAATFLAHTLLILLRNFPSYYQKKNLHLLSTHSRPCSTLDVINSTSRLLNASSFKADPNKRTFQAYGNAAALFVQMGTYPCGSTTFAMVGLASKPIHVFGRPWYKSEWVQNNNNGTTVKAKAYKMLPDRGYGRVYTVVAANCTFPLNPNQDNAGGKLVLYAFCGESQRKYEKFTALEESPGSYDDSKYHPPYQYDYLYCGSSLYGNLSASRIREWMAYQARFFGPSSHFVVHDAGGVRPQVTTALEPWVRTGMVTLQDIRGQAEYDGYYYNQFSVVNDYLHRYRHS